MSPLEAYLRACYELVKQVMILGMKDVCPRCGANQSVPCFNVTTHMCSARIKMGIDKLFQV